MILDITEHAKQRMICHGISKEQVKKAIQQGAKFEQTDGFLAKHSYIRVAYKRHGERYRIKTVFVER